MKFIAAFIGMLIVQAAGTAFVGWWTVPVIAGIWTYLLPRRGEVILAALGGGVAWGILLLIVRRNGPVGDMDRVLSGTLQMPPGASIGLTVMYAALLAGAAALVAQALRGTSPGSRS